MQAKIDHRMMVCGTRVFVQSTNIFRFTAGEQALRRFSLKCEPNSRHWRELSEKPRFRKQNKKPTTRVGMGIRVFVQSTKIFRFTAGEQAPRRFSLKCEPNSRHWRELSEKPRFRKQNKKPTTRVGFLFWQRN